MSGHSKWSTIKHKKARVDAQRGKIFTKHIRQITAAARTGGDPDANPRLRTAIENAKAENLPASKIDNAIKKGTGEIPGVVYEEITYEAYGPGGVAIMIDTLTDNKNRTASSIRHILTKHGGNLGEVGCVGWMFAKKGLLTVKADQVDEETLMTVVLDAGADDMNLESEFYEITTPPETFEKVRGALLEAGIDINHAELTRIPASTVKVEGKQAEQILKLLNALEDEDDVQNVSSNFDIPEDVMESLAEAS
jgi:YebC/PmpR family DNA-binding regulatory protein